jgi:hypothetical protein
MEPKRSQRRRGPRRPRDRRRRVERRQFDQLGERPPLGELRLALLGALALGAPVAGRGRLVSHRGLEVAETRGYRFQREHGALQTPVPCPPHRPGSYYDDPDTRAYGAFALERITRRLAESDRQRVLREIGAPRAPRPRMSLRSTSTTRRSGK